jgi:hypothetical protein
VVRFSPRAISAVLKPRALLVVESRCLGRVICAAAQVPAAALAQYGPAVLDLRQSMVCRLAQFACFCDPETVLRRRRLSWCACWSWRSRPRRPRSGRRPILQELQALMRQMAANNRLWVKDRSKPNSQE